MTMRMMRFRVRSECWSGTDGSVGGGADGMVCMTAGWLAIRTLQSARTALGLRPNAGYAQRSLIRSQRPSRRVPDVKETQCDKGNPKPSEPPRHRRSGLQRRRSWHRRKSAEANSWASSEGEASWYRNLAPRLELASAARLARQTPRGLLSATNAMTMTAPRLSSGCPRALTKLIQHSLLMTCSRL
jgi:hypothetical protein